MHQIISFRPSNAKIGLYFFIFVPEWRLQKSTWTRWRRSSPTPLDSRPGIRKITGLIQFLNWFKLVSIPGEGRSSLQGRGRSLLAPLSHLRGQRKTRMKRLNFSPVSRFQFWRQFWQQNRKTFLYFKREKTALRKKRCINTFHYSYIVSLPPRIQTWFE